VAQAGLSIRLAAALALVALAGCGDSAEPAPATRAKGEAVVWAVGDGADGSDPARRLARAIERDRPDALLYLGDVYPDGTPEDFVLRYQPVYGGLAGLTWPTIGNHEYANRASGYNPYWRRHDRAKPWYRVRLAGWEVFSLNSQAAHGPGSPQLRWLERRLAGADGNCRLAFWHRPRYSAGIVHGDAPDVAPLWDALAGHARLVLSGHDHAMMRYRPHDGMTEFVAGSGGATLYETRPDDRLAFSRSGVTGGLRITLAPGSARLEFRSVDGEVLDRSRTRCDPA
jgi:hypothetical protein